MIFVPNLTVWTRVGAGYFIRCPPKGLASSPTLLLELQIRHIRLASFYPPFVYHRGRSCCGVCQCSCPCHPSLRALNSLSQMVPLLNQSRWIKTIPAWRLESSIVPTHFVPPQLHSSTTSVFFRIHSCQLGPCSHSFPLYNLIRVSIHSICMALLWLGRRRKLLKLGRKGKPETVASPNTNLLPEEQGLSNEPQLLLQLKQWNYSLKVWHVFSQKETIPTEHLEKEYR